MVQTKQESGSPRGNPVVSVTYKISLLSPKVELLIAETLHLTVHDDDDDVFLL